MLNTLVENFFHAFLDTDVSFGRYVEIFQAIFFSCTLGSAKLYFPLIWYIDLVSNEDSWDASIGVKINGVDPILDIFEGFIISYIECNNDSVSLFVERVCQSLKSLLTCGIPYLDSCILTVTLVFLGNEVQPKGGDVLLIEFLVRVSLDKRCFSYGTVSQNNDLNLLLLDDLWFIHIYILKIEIIIII